MQSFIDLQWKTAFDGRWPLVEDDVWWKATCDGRWPLMEEDLWYMTDNLDWWKTIEFIYRLWKMKLKRSQLSLRQFSTFTSFKTCGRENLHNYLKDSLLLVSRVFERRYVRSAWMVYQGRIKIVWSNSGNFQIARWSQHLSLGIVELKSNLCPSVVFLAELVHSTVKLTTYY